MVDFLPTYSAHTISKRYSKIQRRITVVASIINYRFPSSPTVLVAALLAAEHLSLVGRLGQVRGEAAAGATGRGEEGIR